MNIQHSVSPKNAQQVASLLRQKGYSFTQKNAVKTVYHPCGCCTSMINVVVFTVPGLSSNQFSKLIGKNLGIGYKAYLKGGK